MRKITKKKKMIALNYSTFKAVSEAITRVRTKIQSVAEMVKKINSTRPIILQKG